MIIRLLDLFINKRGGESHKKLFAPTFSEIQKTIYKYILDVILLPDTANVATNAIVKSLYRLKISHLNLLEWTTSSDAESKKKASLTDYYVSMIFSVISGMIFMRYPFSFLWIFSPLIMYLMSKKEDRETSKISKQNEKYLLNIGQKTWNYFKENMTNFLVNDNYQEGKRNPCTKRTSPTNIGLEILAIISSYDLGYETEEYVIDLLENVIKTIEILPKWNGHLYNWYDTEKLVPIYPLIISSIDSGNLIGYLYTLKQFLVERAELIKDDKKTEDKTRNYKKDNSRTGKETIENLIERVDKLINEADFSKLFDERLELFSIGFNIEENKLIEYYYDLLASESRQTTLVAIAKKDIPSKSWNALRKNFNIIKRTYRSYFVGWNCV